MSRLSISSSSLAVTHQWVAARTPTREKKKRSLANWTPNQTPVWMQFLQKQWDTRRDRAAGRGRGGTGRPDERAVQIGAWCPLQTHLLAAWIGRPVPWGMSVTAFLLLPPPPKERKKERKEVHSCLAFFKNNIFPISKAAFLLVWMSGLHRRWTEEASGFKDRNDTSSN